MFADEIKLGVITVNVKELREMVEQKVQKGTKVIYEVLISKIAKENSKLEEEFLALEKRLESQPENIEQLDQLRIFCNDTLETELAALKLKIDEVMKKMDLLEVMYFKISYEDFSKAWNIYGMPLDLR